MNKTGNPVVPVLTWAGGPVAVRSGDSERRPAHVFPPPPRGPRHHHTPARIPMRKAHWTPIRAPR